MPQHVHDEEPFFLQRKVPILYAIVAVFILIVLCRLVYLQAYQGKSYRALSQQISVREEELRARRGLILDRNGVVLADNRSSFEIVIIPQFLRDRERVLNSLAQIIQVTKEDIEKKLADARINPPFLPVVIKADAPYDLVSKIKEYDRPDYTGSVPVDLEGVEVRLTPLRSYPYPELFSHVLGYLKEVDRPDLKKFAEKVPGRYSLGDLWGASGLERAFDLDLRGEDGVNARVVDARGKEIRGNPDLKILESTASYAPTDGKFLLSTLDFDAQKVAAEAMGERRGAVVAMDPLTGEVLVLTSSPGYDANKIIKNIDKDYWRMINTDENKYLFNRAIQGTYPSGSTYKIVDSVAGLMSGKITTETQFTCGGGLKFGNRFFQCWKSGGHGAIQLVRAITQSCDVFFYNVGLKVGVDGLKKYATLLGLGQKTGIEIPYEEGGLIPSSEWKMKRFKQPWIESETLSIAIGQGYDLVSPIQNARMIAMIANGGHEIAPHLLKGILDADRKVLRSGEPKMGPQVIPTEILKPIQEGLIGVVQGEGTARALRASPYKIAGKTGTAQVVGNESKFRGERRDHAWFVAYAPYDNPKIAVAVLVENGGHGGVAAAPVAQAVIDTYLGKIMPLPKEKKEP